jgi:hypothetical protein
VSQAALEDLAAACRAQPGSAALLRALLSAAAGSEAPWVAAGYLAEADPGPFDAGLRREVAAFLREADRGDAAEGWDPRVRQAGTHGRGDGARGEVVSLAAHKAETAAPTSAPAGRERLTSPTWAGWTR